MTFCRTKKRTDFNIRCRLCESSVIAHWWRRWASRHTSCDLDLTSRDWSVTSSWRHWSFVCVSSVPLCCWWSPDVSRLPLSTFINFYRHAVQLMKTEYLLQSNVVCPSANSIISLNSLTKAFTFHSQINLELKYRLSRNSNNGLADLWPDCTSCKFDAVSAIFVACRNCDDVWERINPAVPMVCSTACEV